MKKLTLLTAVCAIGALSAAHAFTCTQLGIALDGSCAGTVNQNVLLGTGCPATGCVYMDCDGICMCATQCPTCPSDCRSSTSWTLILSKAGYETQCDTSVPGKRSCKYRCAAGYYGTANSLGTSGCTECPSSGGVAGKSVAGDNAAITKCYIPSGSSFSDSAGSGTYTADCYWSE